jgi:hypothetical protein
MAKKVYTAIMGCGPEEHDQINVVGQNVYDNMYDKYAAMFVTPPVADADFLKQVTNSTAAQTRALESGGKQDIADRNTESRLTYDMLNVKTKPYVNNLYRGDKSKLSKSGFRISKEPEPHGVPLAPRCKYAKNGKEQGSVKFILEKLAFPEGQPRETLKFYIYMTEDPESVENLKLVVKGASTRNLIVKNVTRGKDYYYYITAMNSAGESERSERIRYMLN